MDNYFVTQMVANLTGKMDDCLVTWNDSQFDWDYGWLFGYVKW